MYTLNYHQIKSYIAHPDGTATIVYKNNNITPHRMATLEFISKKTGTIFKQKYPSVAFVGHPLMHD